MPPVNIWVYLQQQLLPLCRLRFALRCCTLHTSQLLGNWVGKMLLTPCPSEHAATIATCSSNPSSPSSFPVLVTAHRIDCHCHCPCSCPCCSRIASSLAYYYVNSFHLFPFRAAFFFSPFFFLCLSRWKHVRKHLNQLCPKRHSQRGRAAASAIVMQNASTRPNQAANVLKLTQHKPLSTSPLLSSSHCQQFRATRKTK